MTGVQTLLARTALGCGAAAATIALPQFRQAYTWSSESFRRRYLLTFGGLRMLLFTVVFLLLRIAPRGDLPGIYISELKSFLLGRVPYRDYASSYAPLFPYLYAPVYRLHASPLTLIFASILVETATAAIFLRFIPRVLTEPQTRAAALLCLLNPISLQFVTIDGQNNVLIGLFLALALLWLSERREVLSGGSLGLSIASVKFLPLLFVPVFPLFLRRRAATWLEGCVAVITAVYGYFALVLHAPVLQALQREGEIKSAGGLPFLIEAAAGRDLGRLSWDVLLLAALAGIWFAGLSLARRTLPHTRAALAATTFLLPALLLAVMGLGKKTWPTYTEMVLFPLAMAVAASVVHGGRLEHGPSSGRQGGTGGVLWLMGAFSLLSVVAHSVWSSILGQAGAVQVHGLLRAGNGAAWLLLLLEVALFGTYAALAWLCLREARRSALAPAA